MWLRRFVIAAERHRRRIFAGILSKGASGVESAGAARRFAPAQARPAIRTLVSVTRGLAPGMLP
jgi:plasmid stabilization system protein ParE